MERSDLVELHKELGYGGAERLYQAAARQLREADTAFRPTELRQLAKDVASKSKEKRPLSQADLRGQSGAPF